MGKSTYIWGITNWERPDMLYLLLSLFVIFAGYLLYFRWKSRKQKDFGKPAILGRLAPRISHTKSVLKSIFFLLALAALIMSLANFRIGTRMETVRRQGIDIVFAVDVSRSMLVEDIKPNRLEKAKRLVSETLNTLTGDRIGIIAYAGQAYPQLPITTDYGAGKMFLQGMNTNMLSSQGTAIGAAIELASSFFDDDSQTNRVLVILSDGENHENGITEPALALAQRNGIQVFTMGIGTAKGGPIPEQTPRGRVFKKDAQGEVIVSRLNREELLRIAEKGGGVFVDGTRTEEAVGLLKEYLDKIDKFEYESQRITEYRDMFQWFLGAALFLLVLDIFTLDRKTAWFQKLNLFNEKSTSDE